MSLEIFIVLVVCGFFAAFLLRRPLLRPLNLMLFYWAVMVCFGIVLFPYSSLLVRIIDVSLLGETIFLYVVSFVFFCFGVIVFKLSSFRSVDDFNLTPFMSRFSIYDFSFRYAPIYIILFCSSLVLFFVFYKLGYVPFFTENQHVTKYFQGDMDLFVKYRPIYTLVVNSLSTLLMFLLVLYFQCGKRRHLLVLILWCSFLILLTAKRGPLLLPFLYLVVGVSVYKKNYFHILIFGTCIAVVAIVINMSMYDSSLFGGFVNAMSSSLFVGVRELTRLLTIFDGEFLWGKSYIAGLLSFIPTEWFEFKSMYNYMRYIMILEGAEAGLSGGMRASYIGEAFINFGMVGVVVISAMFGFVVSFVDKRFMQSSFVMNHGLMGIVCFIALFHVAVVGFFENGSSAFLFTVIRVFMFYLLFRYVLKVKVEYSAS